jgi:hypothetical protein
MADEKPNTPESTAGPSRGRRRPVPTLDLTATEVATESSEATKPREDAPAEAPAAEATAASEATTAQPESVAGAAEESPQEPAAAGDAPPQLPEPEAEPPRRSAPPLVPMLGAAVGGSAIVAIVMLALWGIPQRNGGAAQQAAQLAALETRVRDLAGRIPASERTQVTSLAERIGKLEAAAGSAGPTADPAIGDKIVAAERQVGALTRELAALKQRTDTNAAVAESAQRAAAAAAAKAETIQATDAQGAAVDRRALNELGERLSALENTARALRSDIAQQKTALAQQEAALAKEREQRADQRAVRLAVAAELLKAAVARGERFRGELDATKALAANKGELAPLEQFADTGVPSVAALGQQLRAALPAMRKAAAPKAATTGSFLERLQVNAERLVRIQPIEEQRGDDAGATLTRIDAKAGRGDIAGVLAELKTLPPNVRAPAESWIKTAQAREAAIEASRRFAAAHVGALAGQAR